MGALARAYPEEPLVSCQVLVREGSHVLLVRRARPPLKGYWALPGGAVALGETVVAAAVREVQEETGLLVEVSRYLGYRDRVEHDEAGKVRYHYVVHYFEAQPQAGELQAADDAADVAWLPVSSLAKVQITDSVRDCCQWAGIYQ